MRRTTLRTVSIVALAALGGAARAQSGGDYVVTRSVVGGGSSLLSGGGYMLGSTTGQSALGTVYGGNYALSGGFWGSEVTPSVPAVGDDVCVGGANDGGSCSTDSDCAGGVCGLKSRYITFTPITALARGQEPLSIQVTIASMPFAPAREGEVWWAGPEEDISNGVAPMLRGAKLECTTTPHAQAWTGGFLHLTGAAVVPNSEYEIRMCDDSGANCSGPLTVATGKWGEVVAPFVSTPSPNFGDVTAIKDKFQGETSASHDIPRTDLAGPGSVDAPNVPDEKADFTDVPQDLAAFQGGSFPYPVPACP